MSGDEKLTTEEQSAAEAAEPTPPTPEAPPSEEAKTESAPSETPAAEAVAPAEVAESSTETAEPSSDETASSTEEPAPESTPPVEDASEPEATPKPTPEPASTPARTEETTAPSNEEPATPPVATAAAAASTEDAPTEDAKAERKRPRLNPTGADAAKAVPNLAAAPPAQPVAPSPPPPGLQTDDESPEGSTEPAAAPAAEQPADPTPPPPPSADPVVVPKADDLGDDLDAQIAAAMSTDEKQAEQQAAAAEAARVAAEQQEENETDEGAGEKPESKPQGVVPVEEDDLEPGKRLTGKILSIHSDNVFLDVGSRMNAVVTKRQFQSNRPPVDGQLIQVVVDKVDVDEGLIQCSLPKGTGRVAGNWDRLTVGQVVECYVNKTNKGGLEVAVSGIRGFLPASQIDFRFVDDMEAYVGQKFRVKVTEVNPKKRNLVVSRRAILVDERKEAEKELWDRIDEGQTLEGEVKTLKPYGAFVDIGGADGFLHVGEISWNHVKDPSEVLRVGQQVEVKILKLDREAKKIGLGMKQLAQNPWSNVGTKYPEGSEVTGKVTRAMDFGAFVELEEGVEGLIHISELDHKRVRKVTDVVHVGRNVTAKVLSVDARKKRIGLSVKALTAAPEKPKDEDLAPGGDEQYVRKRKGPLRGGTGTSEAGGGLFGNPDDFK